MSNVKIIDIKNYDIVAYIHYCYSLQEWNMIMLTYEFGTERREYDPVSLTVLKTLSYTGLSTFFIMLPETVLYLFKVPFFTSHAALFHHFPMITGISYFVGMASSVLCCGDIAQPTDYSYVFDDSKSVSTTSNPLYIDAEYAVLAYNVSDSKIIITKKRIGNVQAFQALIDNGLLTQLTFNGKTTFKKLMFNQKGLVPFTENYVLNDNINNVILKDDAFFSRLFDEIDRNGSISDDFVKNAYERKMLFILYRLKALSSGYKKGERYEWYKEHYYK